MQYFYSFSSFSETRIVNNPDLSGLFGQMHGMILFGNDLLFIEQEKPYIGN